MFMSLGDLMFVPVIVFVTIVLPIWLVLHYITKWKQSRGLSSDDERMLEDMWQSATRMEERIQTLEEILDAKSPEWRKS